MHLFTQSIVVLWENMISGSPAFNVWLKASGEMERKFAPYKHTFRVWSSLSWVQVIIGWGKLILTSTKL